MIRVFSAGVFDFFHEGHRFFLESAKALGDELWVVVARDKNVFTRKQFFPHFSEMERLTTIQDAQIANVVLLGEEEDFFLSVEKACPQILALGYDQQLPSGFEQRFPDIQVVSLPAKNPEKWKSSFFRKAEERL